MTIEEEKKQQQKDFKKVYKLIRQGFVKRDTEPKHIKYYDGEPYLKINRVKAQISFITKYSYMDTDIVLWI